LTLKGLIVFLGVNMFLKRFCLHIFGLFVLLLTLSFHASANNDATYIPSDITQIFPSATRIGTVEPKLPVTPVYQLNELLGYVFESDNFTDFIGFSGDTINVLIGIDTQGTFTGLKVLNHHEPIFLHGLGEQPMVRFVNQYQGHSIKERFIINSRDKSSKEVTYFDGITRATVSVQVINDTIITSALQVARAKLDGFVAASTVKINTDFYQTLNFTQLVEKGYINHWQLSAQQAMKVSAEVAREINQLSSDESNFIELYFGFVDIPIIGKNLLGDAEYQRLLDNLKPGEHAIMFFNLGDYSFISDEFVPQTVPSRLSAEQSGFPVDIRDIDFYSYYDPSFTLQLPEFTEQKVFRIKSQSGFEINKPINFSLAVNYNQSFLSKQQQLFSFNALLPENLFIQQQPQAKTEKRRPLWQQIWLNRTTEIVLLLIYLSLLTAVFIKQKSLAKNANATHYLRFIALSFVIIFIGFYAQGQLSVVNIYTFLLALVQGFNIELFLLDPIIFILWLFVFLTLFLWGRGMFCGWLCPFGALQEFVGILAKKLNIKQLKIKPSTHLKAQKIKYLLLVLLVGCSFYSLTLAEQLAEIEPFKTSITLNFVRYWPFTLYAVLLLAIGLKIHKFYCRYLCPLGAGLAVLGRFPVFKWLTRRAECGSPCQLCRTKKCDIDAIQHNGDIDYHECIQCLECLVTVENPKLCVISKYKDKAIKVTKVS